MDQLREFQRRNGPIPVILIALGLVVWGAGGEDYSTIGVVIALVGVAWSLLWWKDARAKRAHQSRDALTE